MMKGATDMKKLIALLLCLVMVVSLAACGEKKDETNKGGSRRWGRSRVRP